MHFCSVLIEDFRGFSQISRFSTVFVHAFERFQVVNGWQMRSFYDSLHGSYQFSDKNPRNLDAWCKVLPERGQKRSGHENHGILQSVTWTCSKHDFSCIFEGSPSMIFGDFRRFHDFALFFCIVLNASRKQFAFRYAHFLGFFMDPNNFRLKINEIS